MFFVVSGTNITVITTQGDNFAMLGKLYSFLTRLDQNDLPFSFCEGHDLREPFGFDGYTCCMPD